MPLKKGVAEIPATKADELIWFVLSHILPDAYDLLPGKMRSTEASAQMIAIGLQESKFEHRRQVVEGGEIGPARSFFQFERMGGCAEVLDDPLTAPYLKPILAMLRIAADPRSLHEAMQYNDIVACVCCRLLLWKDPWSMPGPEDAAKGWTIYQRRWRPGRPHPASWPGYFATAWAVVRV